MTHLEEVEELPGLVVNGNGLLAFIWSQNCDYRLQVLCCHCINVASSIMLSLHKCCVVCACLSL